MTRRVQPLERDPKAILGVWIDDIMLEQIEALAPATICVVPWLPTDIERWRETWAPVDLRTGQRAEGTVLSDKAAAGALGQELALDEATS